MQTLALTPILLYALLGLLLLFLGVLVYLIVRLRAAQRRQASPPPGQPATVGTAAETGVTVLPVLQLRRSFARAIKHPKAHVGRHYRYQSPWFLLLGEAASG